jgi:hypothetical protein
MGARIVAITVGLALLGAIPAAGQPRDWTDRGVALINVGYQGTANDFAQTVTFVENIEEGSIDTDYASGAAPFFDAGIAVRLWRNLGAGVAISHYKADQPAQLEARLPHLFYFNRFRTVTAEIEALKRTETGIHVEAVYALPLGNELLVVVSGGPSFFNVSQDLVTAVQYTHAFPFDTAVFTAATVASDSASATGFNIGADASWRFTRTLGVGGGFRYARGEVDLTASEGNDVTVKVGGVQALFGLRVLF